MPEPLVTSTCLCCLTGVALTVETGDHGEPVYQWRGGAIRFSGARRHWILLCDAHDTADVWRIEGIGVYA